MKNIMKKLALGVAIISMAATLGVGQVFALTAQEGAEMAKTPEMPTDLIGASGVITKATNIILYAVGAVSVIMLIWGGFRYVVSGGDNKKVTDAKNTILYAIIGLIIAIMAYAIVNFVLNVVSEQPGTGEAVEEAAQEAGMIIRGLIS